MLTSIQLVGRIAVAGLWRAFLFAIMAVVGVFIIETRRVKPVLSE